MTTTRAPASGAQDDARPQDGGDAAAAEEERWDAALAGLEQQVRAAESLLAGHVADGTDVTHAPPWTPPTGLGTMPRHLRPRAQRLLARQQYVAARLAEAAERTRREITALARLEANADRRHSPAFVDRSA